MTIVIKKVAARKIELVRYTQSTSVGLGMVKNMQQAHLHVEWIQLTERVEEVLAQEQAQEAPKRGNLASRAAELAFAWGKSLTTKRNRRQVS